LLSLFDLLDLECFCSSFRDLGFKDFLSSLLGFPEFILLVLLEGNVLDLFFVQSLPNFALHNFDSGLVGLGKLGGFESFSKLFSVDQFLLYLILSDLWLWFLEFEANVLLWEF